MKQQTPKHPIVRPAQVWNQNSSSISNPNSNPGDGTRRKNRSFLIKLFTCFRAIDDDFQRTPNNIQASPSPSPFPPSSPYSLKASYSRSNSKVVNQYSSSSSRSESDGNLGPGAAISEFSFEDVYRATANFSPGNVIGEGGSGTVYRGKFRNGSLIAVKRIKKQNYGTSNEFKNEILALSKIEHLNLVRFFGYLEHGDEHIILVEHVGNGTLREHLDGKRGNGLEIGERLDILIDVAHAVTYLHTYSDPPIIHRDIKSSNILITDKLRAKVADFGFARINVDVPGATHISTQVRGTAGYLDPEYLTTYQLTEKSDVYSFGVLLVELVTGRMPIESSKSLSERSTLKWALQRLKGGEVVLAMDPKLRRTPASLMVVEKVLRLARQCTAPSRQSRPSMKRCAEALWTIRKNFHEQTEAALTPSRSVQVAQLNARKNRQEFFGSQDSESYKFQSA